MLSVKYSIKVIPDSKAEEFVVRKLCPLAKGKPICRLGILFGENVNTYTIPTSVFGYIKMKKMVSDVWKK